MRGRAGAQLSYVSQLSTNTFLVPFASAAAWHSFKNETDLTIDFISGGPVDASTAAPKDFMQYDFGIALSNTIQGISAFAKGTIRSGEDINGTAISVGGRMNF